MKERIFYELRHQFNFSNGSDDGYTFNSKRSVGNTTPRSLGNQLVSRIPTLHVPPP
jgi:hypothetical protein